MKLLVLNGASCSGKSTIIKNIMKEKEGYFHLSYDSLKWQFSKYVSGKYYKDIHIIMLSILDAVCKLKHNVICEAYHRESREKLISLAKEYGYQIIEINLEADFEVLSERFEQRVSEALANPEKRVANRTIERFTELFDIYQKEKNPSAIIFRTDTKSIKEVSDAVIALL
ncbi:MAG: AAA family ATPase [Candidatus Pacebacteria bacterium]|nr:AAA family ATPase [Candidatus Paceibacterota bacterium]